MPEWPRDGRKLCEGITRNVHEYFALQDADAFKDPLTEASSTVGGLLADLARLLLSRSARPFTYQRLQELAELSPATMSQYAAGHGFAYLQAALRLANVTSSSNVFEDFDKLLDERTPDCIRLEPISWTSAEVLTLTTLNSDSAWGLTRELELDARAPDTERERATNTESYTESSAQTQNEGVHDGKGPAALNVAGHSANPVLGLDAETGDRFRSSTDRRESSSSRSQSSDYEDDAKEQENKRKREREGGAAESSSNTAPDAIDEIPSKSSRLDL